MANRRDDAFITLARFVNEFAIAALHFLFNHTTPPDTMIRQLAIPFVVIEGDFAFLQTLLRRFSFAPRFAAVEFVEFAFGLRVPRIEKFARITALWLAIGISLGEHLFRRLARFFLVQLLGHFDLLLGVFE